MTKITYNEFQQNFKTVGTPSFSGASEPSKPSVAYDGDTPTRYSAEHDPVLRLKDAPGIQESSFPEAEHYAPCINPSCKSYGKNHPNCRCYAGPGGTSLENSFFAHGGAVCSNNLRHHQDCEHFADGAQVEQQSKFQNEPEHALNHSAVHHGLLGMLTKLGNTRSEDPGKHFSDYHDSYKRGHKAINHHMKSMLGHAKHEIQDVSKDTRSELKNHLDDLKVNPEKILDVGGDIGQQLPAHAAQLGAFAGTAVNYLESLKPMRAKANPLDHLSKNDKYEENKYNRNLDIAQNPMLIVGHVKDGTLMPQDLQTLSTLYPQLHKTLVDKAGEELINSQTKGIEIPYKQKMALSMLVGQPLDSTMTPQSMQAIIKSQALQQTHLQTRQNPKKATGVELKQINKVNDLYATDLQDRQIDKLKD